jgi:apolipoprotein D and lipocalin family protein
MSCLRALVVSLSVTVLSACSTTPNPPLATVPQVDPVRYSGRWYEQARLPTPFQRPGSLAIADYALQGDGSLSVTNTAVFPDGRTGSIGGTATPVPGSGNARLRVRFRGFAALAPVPAAGNYWILGLDPAYQIALVGTPDRGCLWLLSRQKHLPAASRQVWLSRAKSLGFDTQQVVLASWPRS